LGKDDSLLVLSHYKGLLCHNPAPKEAFYKWDRFRTKKEESAMRSVPESKDKPLFTPGPLTTSRTVKQAMLKDLGSRDFAFIQVIQEIRDGLLALAGATNGEYVAVPMQGSGTFAVEAVLTSTIPRDGKVLIVINGAYGHRMVKLCKTAGVACAALEFPEDACPQVGCVAEALDADPSITHVAVVHCETTTGIVNPIRELGLMVHEKGRLFFVDAMSSFGAVPVNVTECRIDYIVSSSNKCVEGVPGFAYAIARKEPFMKTKGLARSMSLDLYAQWEGLESNGQFRFTPPTHALLAFRQALKELEEEGGVEGRATRYRANYDVMIKGMIKLGFQTYLDEDKQGYIITSFRYPEHPNFDFEAFYRLLNDKGYVIYPGKVSNADCFRIGTIGRIFEPDMQALLSAIRDTLDEMHIEL
jgi:2-aminoethylphosphonate-pyruvate transaminase